MSEVGNKALLRIVAGVLDILNTKQFPSVLDTSDIKAVVDISNFINPLAQEFIQLQWRPINGFSGSTNWDLLRIGGLSANGSGVYQKNIGEFNQAGSGDKAEAELYNYRILSSGFKIIMDATALAAEAANGINWKFEVRASDSLRNDIAIIPPPDSVDLQYHTANVGNGLAFDADSSLYHISNQSPNSSPNSGGSTWPGFVPGYIGAGLLVNLLHRTLAGAGPTIAWTGAGTVSIQTFCYGIRFPKTYKGPW